MVVIKVVVGSVNVPAVVVEAAERGSAGASVQAVVPLHAIVRAGVGTAVAIEHAVVVRVDVAVQTGALVCVHRRFVNKILCQHLLTAVVIIMRADFTALTCNRQPPPEKDGNTISI